MSDIAIRVENLSKRYRIGKRERYRTLRDTLTDAFARPARAVQSLVRRNTAPAEPENDSTIWALRDVSFDVKRGEVVGVIGRNGAGKSTLLKVLSRITRPTEGQVRVQGRVGSLLEVGTGFHPELTGRENIFLNGAILGMKRNEITRKFDEIVAFSEIEKFIDTPVKHYSSGMYMRLAFAVAAHLEPEVLIVDEVLAVGDAQFQKKCLGKMGEVAGEGRTVLFVSHNMGAVEQLCRTGIWLDHGELVQFSSNIRSMVTEYLSGGNNVLLSQWINSGKEFNNSWVQPLSFSIVDQLGMPMKGSLRNDDDVWVQLELEVRQVETALCVGYALFSEAGELLYWSYQTDTTEQEWPSLKKGRCLLKSKFPQRLLNEGVYRLELIGGLHWREWFFEPGTNAPAIQVTIQGGLSDSPHWNFRRPGKLAPVIPWHIVE